MAAKTLTSTLIVRLLNQVSGPARDISRSLLGLNNQAKGGFGSRLATAMDNNNRSLDAARGKLFDAAAGFYLLKKAIAAPIQAAMQFESAMADVRKVVDFATPEGFDDFKASLVALSKEVPVSVDGLAAIAAAAGQAGYGEDDLLRVTRAAAMLGVAFDISAEKAGDAIPQLQNSIGLTLDEVMSLADAMNHLSNKQASSAGDILEVTTKIGSYAKLAGFSAEQTAALASAMLSTGQEVDVVATSIRNLGSMLGKGASATAAQKKGFAALGLEANDVSKAMQDDAMGTFADVLERINKLPAHRRGSVMQQIFGSEARALGPLLGNVELLPEALALIQDEADYANSALKEFELRAKTFANAVQLFNNRITAMKIVIGEALIPALTDLMTAISPVIEKISAFAQEHPQLTRNVLAAAAAVVAFKVAINALTFVGLLGKGGVLSLMSIGFNTVGKAAMAASRNAKGMVAFQNALATMAGVADLKGFPRFVAGLRGIALAVPGASAIGGALSAIGAALGTLSLPVLGLVAVGVAAIGAAGVLIYKYWDRITSTMGGFAKRLGEEVAPALELAKPLFSFFGEIGSQISRTMAPAIQGIQDFMGWIGSFFQQEVGTEEQKARWREGGYDMADAMIVSVKAKIAELIEWFKGLGPRILGAVGGINLGDAFSIKWERPGWMGGGPTEGATPPGWRGGALPQNKRRRGGAAWQGGSFLVGEEQPEIFQPRSSGRITPLDKALAGGGGGSTVNLGGVVINIKGSGDPKATAQAVADELNRLSRGAHSDSEAWT